MPTAPQHAPGPRQPNRPPLELNELIGYTVYLSRGYRPTPAKP